MNQPITRSGCIVIVTYQGAAHVTAALDSCAEHAPAVPAIIVDNASSDDTPALARGHPSKPTLIIETRNRGYGAGANRGFRQALAMGARWALLLNQDVLLTPEAVPMLVEVLDATPSAAAVQPLILRPDGRINSAGNPLHYLGFSYAGGNGLTLADACRDPSLPWLQGDAWRRSVEIPVVSGAAAMFRLDALVRCGGFEPALFLYHEDFELSLRLRAAGWTLHLAGDATVVHDYMFSRNPRKWYHLERNRIWVLLAHLRRRTLAVLALPLLAAECAVWVRALTGGWSGEKLRSYFYWASPGAIAYLRKRRRQFADQRRVDDRALLAPATPYMADEGGPARLFSAVSAVMWRLARPAIR